MSAGDGRLDPTGGALAGWRVLVPHAGEWGERVSALLAAHGATATVVPLIEFETPHDLAPLDAAVRRLADGAYQWLVVTSGTAVQALAARAASVLDGTPDDAPASTPDGALASTPDAALARAVRGTRVAAVGPGTARALERAGIRVDLLPAGERSARGLVAEFPPSSGGGVVLHPHSDLADHAVPDGLAARGWEVDAPVAYRTVTGTATGTVSGTEVREDVRAGVFQAVMFSSGSTVRGMLEVVGTPPPTTVIACIGPRTERAARDAGLPVAVVSRLASAEGLVAALAEHAAHREAR